MNARTETRLLARAAAAARQAHAPYSGYRVGAALLASDGSVFSACNVENASYGLTLCAERAAVAAAVAPGQREFRAVAVVAAGSADPYPCGACRQVLAEFCGPELLVLVARGGRREAVRLRLGDLLPQAFALRRGKRQGRKKSTP